MLKLIKLKEKEMQINDILLYIQKNSPDGDNTKASRHKDDYDIEGRHIKREYVIKDINDIVNTFIMERKITEDKDIVVLTHIYENPHQELNLDDYDDDDFY